MAKAGNRLRFHRHAGKTVYENRNRKGIRCDMMAIDDLYQASELTSVLSSILSLLDTTLILNANTISELSSPVVDVLSSPILEQNIPGEVSLTTVTLAAASIDFGAIFSKAATTGKAGK